MTLVIVIIFLMAFVIVLLRCAYDCGWEAATKEAKSEIEMLQNNINKLLKANYK